MLRLLIAPQSKFALMSEQRKADGTNCSLSAFTRAEHQSDCTKRRSVAMDPYLPDSCWPETGVQISNMTPRIRRRYFQPAMVSPGRMRFGRRAVILERNSIKASQKRSDLDRCWESDDPQRGAKSEADSAVSFPPFFLCGKNDKLLLQTCSFPTLRRSVALCPTHLQIALQTSFPPSRSSKVYF